MKRFKLLLIVIFVFLFGMVNVDAMTLKPSGDSKGKRGEQITIYITLSRLESEKTVSAVDGNFSYDSNVLTLVSSESLMSGWTQFSSVSNNGTFSYANLTFDKLITSTSKNVAKVVFKIAANASYGNTTINVSNPSATDEVGDGVVVTGGSHTVKVLSDVNTLTGLTVTGVTFTFDENATTYDLELNSDSVSVVATKKDSNSTISGDIGTKSLKYGKNTLKIMVKSESGISKVYTLNITRPDNRSKDNSLSSLKISAGTLKFNKDTTTYNLTVKSDIEKIKVDATLTDEKASFVSGYGSREVKLNVGKNVIEVRVRAENESVRTYIINVTREDNRSDNSYLSELVLSDGKISFDKGQLEYKVVVSHEVDKIELTVKAEDSKAKYKVDMPEKLEVGENIITIEVTAENGAKREYKVIVERKAESEKLSDNNKLSSITISGYEINFNSNVYEYNLKIEDENSLKINYQQEDSSSIVEINGNENLKNGSVIFINVTSEMGVTAIYRINIEKKDSNNLMLYIVIGGVVLLVLVIIIIISLKKKKEPKSSIGDNFSTTYEIPVSQNMTYMQVNNAANGIQNVQNVQNTAYTSNSQNIVNTSDNQSVQNISNTQGSQNLENNMNNQNNGFF